jgi:oxygen-independent coproporphyrinogen-3 oxidase
MKIYLRGHDYRYASEQILLTMFPGERPEYPPEELEGDRTVITLSFGKYMAVAGCKLYLGGKVYKGKATVRKNALTGKLVSDRLLQRIVKLSFYRAALPAVGKKPVWGALTGIRPGKIMSNYLESGMSENAALNRFCREYDVSRERATLCLDTASAALDLKREISPKDICLYVGIPFCPSRCAYCSFVSQSVEKSMDLIPPFLEALDKEIEATAKIAYKHGLRVISVYIGGGTPTILDETQLGALLANIARRFDLTGLREYTVEAGRPETITDAKLAVLKKHGVGRISVNPQTMEDGVLNNIGRKHTSGDIISALSKVRKAGSFAVNMDLIAGLPGDTPEGFERTLEKVLGLEPENITIHTLSLKKGSSIMTRGTALPSPSEVGAMLDLAGMNLRSGGYRPYYLYRQKYMSGGFENVGWSKPGFNGVYNICIMEELTSIISMGGGASTKLVTKTGRIERLFAPKYPLEYIQKISETVSDKSEIEEFYNGLQSF